MNINLRGRKKTDRAGRVQPHSLELERGALCACMVAGDRVSSIPNLKPEHFYDARHAKIFTAIAALQTRREPIDLLTVNDELVRTGNLEAAGGVGYLMGISNDSVTFAYIATYAKRVIEYAMLRRMVTAMASSENEAYDPACDIRELAGRVTAEIADLQAGLGNDKGETLESMIAESVDQIKERNSGEGANALLSGITPLDDKTGGFEAGDLILIAARPSLGKTDLGLNIAHYVAWNVGRAIFFTLEMPKGAIIRRLLSLMTAIFRGRIRDAAKLSAVEIADIEAQGEMLKRSRLIIHDQPGITVPEIRAITLKEHSRSPLKLICVDYLGLITPTVGDNREQQVSNISKGLKNLARELNIPVIVISQLSRAVEQQQGERVPELSHLRDSGSLEQDADVVLMLYGEWYYKKDSLKQGTDIYIRKHRNGETGVVEQVPYDRGTGKFGEPLVIRRGGQMEYTTKPSEPISADPF